MKNTVSLKYLLAAVIIFLPFSAIADESLSVYGLRGYAYTVSPLPARGLYIQAGGIYSVFNDGLENGDGDIYAVPLSVTYGNGSQWEISAGTHYESWENKDMDIDEKGMGDIFLGGKVRLLGNEKNSLPDISLMPYALIPSGNRDKGIGDLYYINPSVDDDFSWGLNLLIGGRIDRFYLTANLGFNYVDTDNEWINDTSLFIGLAAEYQINESWMGYAEFIHNENKNDIECDPCIDEDADEDMREIGAGIVWLKDKWGFKVHAGAGLSEISPDFRVMGLINRNLAF